MKSIILFTFITTLTFIPEKNAERVIAKTEIIKENDDSDITVPKRSSLKDVISDRYKRDKTSKETTPLAEDYLTKPTTEENYELKTGYLPPETIIDSLIPPIPNVNFNLNPFNFKVEYTSENPFDLDSFLDEIKDTVNQKKSDVEKYLSDLYIPSSVSTSKPAKKSRPPTSTPKTSHPVTKNPVTDTKTTEELKRGVRHPDSVPTTENLNLFEPSSLIKEVKSAAESLIRKVEEKESEMQSFFDSAFQLPKNSASDESELTENPVSPTTPYKKKSAQRKKRKVDCSSKNFDCIEEGFFRLNQSCTKFYECYFEPKCNRIISRLRTCPRCLKFNAKKNICDLSKNVPECTYSNIWPKNYCTGPGKFFVPENCNQYYDCQKNVKTNEISLTVKTCPSGTIFSQKEQICIRKKSCNRHVPKCGPGHFYLSDKFDCGSFYYCISQNKTAALSCPSNSIFDGHICEDVQKSKLNWDNIKMRLLKNH